MLGVTKTNTGCRELCYEYQGIDEINVGNVVRINAGDCYNRTPYRISRKEKIEEYPRKINYSIRAVPFDKRASPLELRYCVEITSKRIQRFTSCTIWKDKRDQPTKNSRWRKMRSSSMTLNEVRVISDKVLAKVFDDVDNEAALISATI